MRWKDEEKKKILIKLDHFASWLKFSWHCLSQRQLCLLILKIISFLLNLFPAMQWLKESRFVIVLRTVSASYEKRSASNSQWSLSVYQNKHNFRSQDGEKKTNPCFFEEILLRDAFKILRKTDFRKTMLIYHKTGAVLATASSTAFSVIWVITLHNHWSLKDSVQYPPIFETQ